MLCQQSAQLGEWQTPHRAWAGRVKESQKAGTAPHQTPACQHLQAPTQCPVSQPAQTQGEGSSQGGSRRCLHFWWAHLGCTRTCIGCTEATVRRSLLGALPLAPRRCSATCCSALQRRYPDKQQERNSISRPRPCPAAGCQASRSWQEAQWQSSKSSVVRCTCPAPQHAARKARVSQTARSDAAHCSARASRFHS